MPPLTRSARKATLTVDAEPTAQPSSIETLKATKPRGRKPRSNVNKKDETTSEHTTVGQISSDISITGANLAPIPTVDSTKQNVEKPAGITLERKPRTSLVRIPTDTTSTERLNTAAKKPTQKASSLIQDEGHSKKARGGRHVPTPSNTNKSEKARPNTSMAVSAEAATTVNNIGLQVPTQVNRTSLIRSKSVAEIRAKFTTEANKENVPKLASEADPKVPSAMKNSRTTNIASISLKQQPSTQKLTQGNLPNKTSMPYIATIAQNTSNATIKPSAKTSTKDLQTSSTMNTQLMQGTGRVDRKIALQRTSATTATMPTLTKTSTNDDNRTSTRKALQPEVLTTKSQKTPLVNNTRATLLRAQANALHVVRSKSCSNLAAAALLSEVKATMHDKLVEPKHKVQPTRKVTTKTFPERPKSAALNPVTNSMEIRESERIQVQPQATLVTGVPPRQRRPTTQPVPFRLTGEAQSVKSAVLRAERLKRKEDDEDTASPILSRKANGMSMRSSSFYSVPQRPSLARTERSKSISTNPTVFGTLASSSTAIQSPVPKLSVYERLSTPRGIVKSKSVADLHLETRTPITLSKAYEERKEMVPLQPSTPMRVTVTQEQLNSIQKENIRKEATIRGHKALIAWQSAQAKALKA